MGSDGHLGWAAQLTRDGAHPFILCELVRSRGRGVVRQWRLERRQRLAATAPDARISSASGREGKRPRRSSHQKEDGVRVCVRRRE